MIFGNQNYWEVLYNRDMAMKHIANMMLGLIAATASAGMIGRSEKAAEIAELSKNAIGKGAKTAVKKAKELRQPLKKYCNVVKEELKFTESYLKHFYYRNPEEVNEFGMGLAGALTPGNPDGSTNPWYWMGWSYGKMYETSKNNSK